MKMPAVTVAFGIAAMALCASADTVGKSTPTGFTDDFAAAKAEAAKSGKKIFAVFSGSDWCHWCKVLEKDYLSKNEFVEEAKKDFVLVFIDSPRDKSVLSETAKENNPKLTREFGIRGFPTVKILDAEGKEIGGSRPGKGVTPKEYAEKLRREVRTGPLVKKHLAPFDEEIQKTVSEAFAGLRKKGRPDVNDEAAQKSMFEEGQKATAALLEKIKSLRAKIAAAQVPEEIAVDKKELLERVDRYVKEMERSLKLTWDDMKKMKIEK